MRRSGSTAVAAAAFRELNDRWQLAVALDHLAAALDSTDAEDGSSDVDSETHRAEVMELLEGFHDPLARRMRARLDSTR